VGRTGNLQSASQPTSFNTTVRKHTHAIVMLQGMLWNDIHAFFFCPPCLLALKPFLVSPLLSWLSFYAFGGLPFHFYLSFIALSLLPRLHVRALPLESPCLPPLWPQFSCSAFLAMPMFSCFCFLTLPRSFALPQRALVPRLSCCYWPLFSCFCVSSLT
jgi:hypothetical protein